MSSIWKASCNCLNITDFDTEYYSMSSFYNIDDRAFTAGDSEGTLQIPRSCKKPESAKACSFRFNNIFWEIKLAQDSS